MRFLLVKTSSLGDVVHNLPVASDLRRTFPDAKIDWCVEESFVDIPRMHPAIDDVIPVAIRRWKKSLFRRDTWREIGQFRRHLRQQSYDAVLDTQGLVKSALISSQARGEKNGYAAEVARESWAARFYDRTFVIPPNAHAVVRNRWLAAAAFDYPVDLPLEYGITPPDIELPWCGEGPFAVLLTATSRADKLWDEAHWISVARALRDKGLTPIFPAGSPVERERAARLAAAVPGALAAPPLAISSLASLIGRARLTIGVDTGLVHLSTALGTPTLAIFVSTDPTRTGVYGTGFSRNLGTCGEAPSAEQVLSVVEQGLRPWPA